MCKQVTNERPEGRVLLWSIHRSLSTAFHRCVLQNSAIETVQEPMHEAIWFGPEGAADLREQHGLTERPESTFNNIKLRLEALPSPVFVKDMPGYLVGQDLDLVIPDTFQHTFMIRHPARVARSYLKAYNITDTDTPEVNAAGGVSWTISQTYRVYQHIKDKMGVKPIVIDASDFQDDPQALLQTYCDAVGLPYDDKMLHWQPGPVDKWVQSPMWLPKPGLMEPWYKAVFASCEPICTPHWQQDTIESIMETLPDALKVVVKEQEAAYYEMAEGRLMPSDTQHDQ
eukprot:TRINITY_DN65945_c0_g1_i4.p1 TRINITY_DN65945_c0_g1~~TRINITY_DN65945_c0_g1_i4.p1  ORF type:complete len:285 (-),score=35.11 TRINITY_DN65945_c0_g1_i4:171-1025(-)